MKFVAAYAQVHVLREGLREDAPSSRGTRSDQFVQSVNIKSEMMKVISPQEEWK
jgi:hypothetical protein